MILTLSNKVKELLEKDATVSISLRKEACQRCMGKGYYDHLDGYSWDAIDCPNCDNEGYTIQTFMIWATYSDGEGEMIQE